MSIKFVKALAIERLTATTFGKRCLEESSEIVVFGSRSAGLERVDSDIDILCIGSFDLKLKTAHLDLNAMQSKEICETNWLQSELASHIAEYGSWIRGTPEWIFRVRIGEAAIEAKRRRIAAFMRALPDKWSRLDEGFREKYATKLRREAQRLLLLESGTPVPPTKMLDSTWNSFSTSPLDVDHRIRDLSKSHRSSFEEDLLSRIGHVLQAQRGATAPQVYGK